MSWLSRGSITLAALILSWSFSETYMWPATAGIVVLTVLWYRAYRFPAVWDHIFVALFFLALAAAAVLKGTHPIWLVLCAAALLTAWDCEHTLRWLPEVMRGDDLKALERAHLRRLLVVNLLGVMVAGAALFIHVDFNFEAAALLSLLAVLGLSAGIGFFRRIGSQ